MTFDEAQAELRRHLAIVERYLEGVKSRAEEIREKADRIAWGDDDAEGWAQGVNDGLSYVLDGIRPDREEFREG